MDDSNTLSQIRKQQMKSNSTVSELALRQKFKSVKNAWDILQTLKTQIADEKRKAAEEIDAKYSSQLATAEKRYAVALKMAK